MYESLWDWHQPDTNTREEHRVHPQLKKKKQANITYEHSYKSLNNILANQIQWYIEEIIHHGQLRLIPGMWDEFIICKSINMMHHIKKFKEKNHYNRCRKSFWKQLTLIHERKLSWWNLSTKHIEKEHNSTY